MRDADGGDSAVVDRLHPSPDRSGSGRPPVFGILLTPPGPRLAQVEVPSSVRHRGPLVVPHHSLCGGGGTVDANDVVTGPRSLLCLQPEQPATLAPPAREPR